MADIPTLGTFMVDLWVMHLMIGSLRFVAIDMIEMDMNTSVLPDEYIGHRLGMIPLISSNCDEAIRYSRVCLSL